MPERKKIVAGNWKMNKTYPEAIQLLYEIKDLLFKSKEADKVIKIIAPPFTYLHDFHEATKGLRNLFVGAQNCATDESGAFTGEVSAAMIKSVGASFVIIGHSERRTTFSETNGGLLKKTNLALKNNLTPIFCIGETADERKANQQKEVVNIQLNETLFHLSKENFGKVVIAYEPVWAIGTGVTATTEQAEEMHKYIRSLIETKYGKDIAEQTSIMYGGSCNPANAAALFSLPDVDGGLIGGASLKAKDFSDIIHSMPQ